MTRRLAVGAAVVVMLISMALVNAHVRGDGNGYYAWLASSVIDGDLDFRNQYRHANVLFADRYLDENGNPRSERLTATGHVENQWALGPSVLWAPWFLAAHAIVKIAGVPTDDGFAAPYLRACAFGTLCYAAAALWFSVAAARRLGVTAVAAWAAALTVWGASSLMVYTYVLPFHVHVMAAFTVAVFLWYRFTRGERLAPVQWAVWGALAGLMGITYHVDLVFLLVVGPVAVGAARRDGVVATLVCLAVFGAAAMLVALPQWIGKAIVYGSPWMTGYRDGFDWLAPRLWSTAFSTEHGVILWTPVVAVGLLGCALVARYRRDVAWSLAAAAVFYIVIASFDNWHGLSSFGNRFFVSWTFLLVMGVSVLYQRALHRRAGAPALATVCGLALMAWNAGLAFQWASKMVPSRGPVDVPTVVAQQWMVPHRAWVMARRYVTDRAALAREIEEQDQREWDAYRRNR